MKIMEIQNQYDPKLRKIISKNNTIALIPLGSIEQHGAHLPISTDSDIVFKISQILATKCNLMVLPTLRYGCSSEHAPYFNISLQPNTLKTMLIDICTSLHRNNINKIIILNGHYGNKKYITKLETKIKIPKLKINVFSYWDFMDNRMDHGGFVETSLMLAISDKTKMSDARKGVIIDDLRGTKLLQCKKKLAGSFPAVTKNGIIGDPTIANIAAGQKIMREIVKNFIYFINLNH